MLTSLKCDHIEYPNHPRKSLRKECGTEVMKKVKIGKKDKLVPRTVYVYYSIIDSLQKFLQRHNFLELCDEWRSRSCSDSYLTDVYNGKLWKDWMKKDGIPLLGNLLFMLNIDWFQLFEHTQYCCGVIYIVIQNLPRAVWFKMENVLIVSTIPGPKEPNYNQLSNYLKPMVDELQKLWQCIQFSCPLRAALSYISSDLPATRKLCGFYGYNAKYSCLKYMKEFVHPNAQFSTAPDYSGFDRARRQLQTHAFHSLVANQVRKACTRTEKEEREQEAGVRYSHLLELPYLDIVRCHLIDPMHNLFLETAKRMVKIWKERGYLNDSLCDDLQAKINLITTLVASLLR